MLLSRGQTVGEVCRRLGVSEQSYYRWRKEYGLYGYRRMTALLGAEGWHVNHKRVERIWRCEGLKGPQKQPKRGRRWLNDGSRIRLRPCWCNHVWAYDFVQGRTHDGRAFRMLTVIDEFTRECLAIEVARRLRRRAYCPSGGTDAVTEVRAGFRDQAVKKQRIEAFRTGEHGGRGGRLFGKRNGVIAQAIRPAGGIGAVRVEQVAKGIEIHGHASTFNNLARRERRARASSCSTAPTVTPSVAAASALEAPAP